LTVSTQKLTAAGSVDAPASAASFGEVLREWLARAGHNQKGLAHAVGVHPSTVTGWMRGHKRPDDRSLVKILTTVRGWLGSSTLLRACPEPCPERSRRGSEGTGLEWQAAEALDAVACLSWDWWTVREAAESRLRKGGTLNPSWRGGRRPVQSSDDSSYRLAL
jgi:transcriptional regulator with XRE-family HTH domain